MANIKISELNPLLTVQDADVIPIVDNAITKKVTAEILRGYTQGNSVLLTGAQTIAGIKTFTSQLASSVATGTAPFSVASTTKVTNLNADLLDGLSSADFQATLSGTGIVKSTAGTISYLTDNSANWNTAFNDSIVSAAVTGSGTNTLTLSQQDAGTITATWVNGTLIREIRNNTGATLTKGTIVYISGATGNKPTVTKAIATGDSTSAQTFGFVQNDILNNAEGFVVVIGDLIGLDTSAFTEGDQLYLSSTTAGAFTDVKQYAPNHLVYVGIVTRAHPTLGQIEVNIQNGYEMDELHNVAAQNPSNGDILQYVTSTGLWTKIAGTTSAISEGSNLYFTNARSRSAISLTTTGTSGAATYNSTTGVLNVPNYGTALANYLPLAGGTLTGALNGTSAVFSSSVTTNSANGFRLDSAGSILFSLGYSGGTLLDRLTGTSFRIAENGTPQLTFATGGAATFSSSVTTAGNLGVGVTPSAWYTAFGTKAIQFAASGSVYGLDVSSSDRRAGLMNNAFINSSGNYIYINTGHSTQYEQNAGKHTWFTAPSGTAGNAITFTSAMTLDASGQLLIGTTTSSTFKLDVVGTSRVSGNATFLANVNLTSNSSQFSNTFGGVTTSRFFTDAGGGVLSVDGANNFSIRYGGVSGTNFVSFAGATGAATFSADATINGITAGRGAGAGSTNTVVGNGSLISNVIGFAVTALGYRAVRDSTANYNTGIGSQALTATTSGGQNVAVGSQSLLTNLTGSNNTAVGHTALYTNTASNNTAVGFEAASANTTGTGITAIGYQSLKASTGANNTALGFTALAANTTGIQNTALGSQSLQKNTTGISNIGIGLSALLNNLGGNYNIAIGVESLSTNTTGNNNVAIGINALGVYTGSNNTAIGFESSYLNSTATGIVSVGYQSLRANTGVQNTGIGFQSLLVNTTGTSNTALGHQSLVANTTGGVNTAIGNGALSANTTGASNSALGVGTQSGNFNASVILGRDATATASNQFVIGSTAYPAGAVATEVNASSKVWNVIINGVAQKILLA